MRRIAAVDMGTNSFHLIIVEVNGDGSFILLYRQREVIRLGSHKGEDLSVISDGETEKAIDLLSNFKSLADYHGAEFYAVATSAVREAQNKNEFLERVFDKVGFDINVIDGRREAELIFLGVQKALPVSDKKVLCIDIGGGSTEFLLADKGKIIFAESIKIGAVRLAKMFFPDYQLKTRAIKDCKFYINQALNGNKNLDYSQSFDIAVGTSGTINAAAALVYSKISGKKSKSYNGLTFSYSDFRSVLTEVLEAQTTAERIALQGMEVKRADIIPAGLLILRRAMKNFNIKEITISEYALREGIILNLIKNH
ncbi:MAG: Ppx/GppA family phosphatase [Ignavibacteriaceae bacterium]|nr:Ppx/GppA family phosphatase [Ignavibacteriaceae bacterium]